MFIVSDGLNWEEVHRALQDVLESLQDIVKSHPSLSSADILHVTANIISSVKGLFLICIVILLCIDLTVIFVTCSNRVVAV